MKYVFLYILACLFTVNAVARNIEPTAAIPGDSYSTSGKYIPGTSKAYYTTTDWSKAGVVDVKQTWRWQVIKKAGFKSGANDSYSGATVSYSGYNDEGYVDRLFTTRVLRLGNPDITLIFSGINNNWADAPIDECKYGDFKCANLYTYHPASARSMELAQGYYLDVMLYSIINDDSRTEIVESTKIVCEHYGIKYVQLQGIGRESGRSIVKGTETIANRVLTLIK